MNRRHFSAGSICRVAAVNPVTLRSWRNRGLLEVGSDAEGWTRYSATDCCVIATTALLTSKKFQAESAATIAEALRASFEKLASYPMDSWRAWALVDTASENPKVKLAWLDERHIAIALGRLQWEHAHVIDIGKVLRRVVDGLHQEKKEANHE